MHYSETRTTRRPTLTAKKPWMHQDELRNAIGRHVSLKPLDTGEMSPPLKLLGADQFTLRVELPDQTVITLFKHALAAYKVLP